MPLVHTHLLNSFRVIYPATSQHSFLKLINKDTVRDFLNAWREKRCTRLLTLRWSDRFLTNLYELMIFQIVGRKLCSRSSLEHTSLIHLPVLKFTFASFEKVGITFVCHMLLSSPIPF